jgi:hypothetical protein
MHFSTLAVGILCALRGAYADTQGVTAQAAPSQDANMKSAVAALQPQLTTGAIITFPWDARWADLQVRGSSPRVSPHYSVVVEVASEADVVNTVTIANRYNIPFLAISGTHGWTKTLNNLPYGIQINMRRLNTTTLQRDGNSAIVGGGTLQYEITRSLFAKGKYAGKLGPHCVLSTLLEHTLTVHLASYWACRMCIRCRTTSWRRP